MGVAVARATLTSVARELWHSAECLGRAATFLGKLRTHEAGRGARWRRVSVETDDYRARADHIHEVLRAKLVVTAGRRGLGIAAGRQRDGQGAGAGVPVAEDTGCRCASDARGFGEGQRKDESREPRCGLASESAARAVIDGGSVRIHYAAYLAPSNSTSSPASAAAAQRRATRRRWARAKSRCVPARSSSPRRRRR